MSRARPQPVDLLVLQPPDFIRRRRDEIIPTFSEERYLPHGGLCLATYLQHHGMRAVVAPLREFYQQRGSYLDFDNGTAASRARFQEKTDRILGLLLERYPPRAVGISLGYAIHHRAVEVLLDRLAVLAPGLSVLLGGNHATFTAAHWLTRQNPCQAVLLGEAEKTCLRLLRAGLDPGEIPGLAVRRKDGSVAERDRAPRLTSREISLPVDLDLAVLPRWVSVADFNHFVMFGRGCAGRCAFCTSPRMWERVRWRDPGVVGEEIGQIVAQGVGEIFIADDTLHPGTKRFAGIARVLGRFPGVRFSAMARVDQLLRADPAVLRRAGISRVYLGVESCVPDVLQAMNKRSRAHPVRGLRRVLERLQAADIEASLFLIIGHPGSSLSRDRETVDVCRELAVRGLVADLVPSLVAPFPGTALADDPGRGGYRLRETRWGRWTFSTPLIDLIDASGRVTYRRRDMRRLFEAIHDLRRELGLGDHDR